MIATRGASSAKLAFNLRSPHIHASKLKGRCANSSKFVVRAVIRFSEEEVAIGSSLGTVGFMSVSSAQRLDAVKSIPGMMGGDQREQVDQTSVADDGVQARLYTGRLVRGDLMGTRVLLKAYAAAGSEQAYTMAANEVAAHTALQPPGATAECDQLAKLLGSFSPRAGPSAGEQWLVFRSDGLTTAAAYAATAAAAGERGSSVGGGEFMDAFNNKRPLERRRAFVLRMLRQAIGALAFMHGRHRLHQSLGPGSLVLNSTDERQPRRLNARLGDLALAVDASDEALFGGAVLHEIWERGSIYGNDPLKRMADGLWMRAREAGAWTELERRSYGVADDVYAAGLLVAYMAFVPFCQPGSVDGPTLQRLLGATFRTDMAGAREFCAADERWSQAVGFLDADGGAGWDLLQATLNPEWRLRPTAESVLQHPWMTGTAVET